MGEITNITGKLPIGMVMKSDNGGEYVGQIFRDVALEFQVRQIFSSAYLHEQNADAEVVWKDIAAMARSMMLSAGLDKKYWPLAFRHAVWLRNRMPNSGKGWTIPYFTIYGEYPDMSVVSIYGAPVFAWIDKKLRKKLANKSKEYVYVGHATDSLSYLLLDVSNGKIKRVGKPLVHEDVADYGRKMATTTTYDKLMVTGPEDLPTAKPKPFKLPTSVTGYKVIDHGAYYDLDDEETYGVVKLHHPVTRDTFWMDARSYLCIDCNTAKATCAVAFDNLSTYLMRNLSRGGMNHFYPIFSTAVCDNNKSDVLKPHVMIVSTDTSDSGGKHTPFGIVYHPSADLPPEDATEADIQFEFTYVALSLTVDDRPMIDRMRPPPRNYMHSQTYPDRVPWHDGYVKELTSLWNKGVFKLCDPPIGQQKANVVTLDGKETNRYKWLADGSLDECKVRYVARGDMQPEDSYDDTFAPSPQLRSIRLILNLSLIWNLVVYHFDVSTAFLNSPLQYDIWLKLPVGLKLPEFGDYKYAKLLKSIYGLKNAAHDWSVLQETWLMKYDSRICKSKVEPCLYHIFDEVSGLIVLILVQVDDYMVATNDEAYKSRLLVAYNATYAIKDLGKLDYIMQTKVNFIPGGVELSQARQIDDLAMKYQVSNAKPKYTPMEESLDLSKADNMDKLLPYLNLLGSLYWIARMTRPDVYFCLVYLAQFSHSYDERHFTALKRVLRYLHTTKHLVLRIMPTRTGDNLVTTIIVDSNWARHKQDRKSIQGSLDYVNGALTDWSSSKQGTVALSATESEYVAAAEGGKNGLHWMWLFKDMLANCKLKKHKLPSRIFSDNQGAIFLSEHPVNSKRTRHIDIRYHALRDWVAKLYIRMCHIAGENNPSDMLTKPLGKTKLEQFRTQVGVVPPLESSTKA
jgi:hypothetical protein